MGKAADELNTDEIVAKAAAAIGGLGMPEFPNDTDHVLLAVEVSTDGYGPVAYNAFTKWIRNRIDLPEVPAFEDLAPEIRDQWEACGAAVAKQAYDTFAQQVHGNIQEQMKQSEKEGE